MAHGCLVSKSQFVAVTKTIFACDGSVEIFLRRSKIGVTKNVNNKGERFAKSSRTLRGRVQRADRELLQQEQWKFQRFQSNPPPPTRTKMAPRAVQKIPTNQNPLSDLLKTTPSLFSKTQYSLSLLKFIHLRPVAFVSYGFCSCLSLWRNSFC